MLETIKLFFKKLLAKNFLLELSYSKISTYHFCPWKYKLIYVDGQRIPPNPYISLGLSVHRALEEFHKNERRDLDDLLDIYNQVWVNEGFQNPQQTMHFYEKGEKMIRQYFEWYKKRKSEIIAVEKEFRFPVGSRILRGIIDRIDRLPDDSYEVIDYKTHAEMWDQSRIDSDLQLTLYALGCKKALQIKPAALSLFFLAHNRVVTTQRTKRQEEEALQEFESVAKKIEKGDFAPDTSKCPKCDFKETCKFSTAKTTMFHAKISS